MSDWVGTAINAVAALVAVGAMIAAIVQASEARKSRIATAADAKSAHEQAERVTAAVERQAAAAEAELEFQREQARQLPWTIEHDRGVIYVVFNSSDRPLRVLDRQVSPVEATDWVRFREINAVDIYGPGERFAFAKLEASGSPVPQTLKLRWSEDGSDLVEEMSLQIPNPRH